MRVLLHKISLLHDKGFLIHVLIWSVFILYEVVFAGLINGLFHPFLQYILSYSLNIGVFYVQAIYIMPMQANLRSAWIKIPLLVTLLLIAYCVLATGNIMLLYEIVDNDRIYTPLQFDRVIYIGFVYRALHFVLLGTGYYYLMRYIRGQAREAQQKAEIATLENQLVQAELDFLRAQVNPHLLFNTLSYIQHVAKTRPADAEQAMDSLSKLMDYSLGSYNKDGVPLREEINYAEQIIRIHQLRYGDTLKLVYTKEIADDRVMVPPLTLVTLLENLFKHGHLTHGRSPAHIRVYADEQGVVFETANIPRKMGTRQQKHAPSGLKNLTERLEMAVPNRHRFTHGMDGENFKTRLELSKDEIR